MAIAEGRAVAASTSDKSSSGLNSCAPERIRSSGPVANGVSEKSYPQLRQRSTCSNPR